MLFQDGSRSTLSTEMCSTGFLNLLKTVALQWASGGGYQIEYVVFGEGGSEAVHTTWMCTGESMEVHELASPGEALWGNLCEIPV